MLWLYFRFVLNYWEKAEQIKIGRPKMLSEEKIVSQSAIEIFNDGTRAWRR